MNAEPAFRPGVRVRRRRTKQTGSVYQLDQDGHAYVKWDDGQFVREHLDELVVASAVDELAAIELDGKPLPRPKPRCDLQVLRALRAELHQLPGGHQREVQVDVEKITTTTARCLLSALRDCRNKLARVRSQPWRNI